MRDTQGAIDLSAVLLWAYSEGLTMAGKGGGGIIREPVSGTF